MLKYEYFNTPFLRRRLKYIDFNEMIRVLRDERVVNRKRLLEMPYTLYNQKENIYKLKCTFDDEKNGEQVRKLPAFSYAVKQLYSDLLDCNILSFIKKCSIIDEQAKSQLINGDPLTKDNKKNLHKIMNNVWYLSKVRKKKKVFSHIVEKSPLMSDARIGCFVSEDYVYVKDYEIFSKVYEKAKEINPNLVFYDGYIDPIKSRMNLINLNPVLREDEVLLTGISVINSEFKESALRFESVIVLPRKKGIRLYGSVAELYTGVRHYGEINDFNREADEKLDVILGKSDRLLNLFSIESRRELLDFDFEEEDEAGDLKIVKALNFSKQLAKDIIEIKIRERYEDNIKGLVYSLMDYATNDASTEDERMKVNNKALDILANPNEFMDKMGRKIDRLDQIILPS